MVLEAGTSKSMYVCLCMCSYVYMCVCPVLPLPAPPVDGPPFPSDQDTEEPSSNIQWSHFLVAVRPGANH